MNNSDDDKTENEPTDKRTIEDVKSVAQRRARTSASEGYPLDEEKLRQRAKKEFNEHAEFYTATYIQAHRAHSASAKENVRKIAHKRGRDAAKRGCAFNLPRVESNAKQFPGFEQFYIDENKRAHEEKLSKPLHLETMALASLKTTPPIKKQKMLDPQYSVVEIPNLEAKPIETSDSEQSPSGKELAENTIYLLKMREQLTSYSNLLKKEYPEQDLVVVPKQMFYLLVENWENNRKPVPVGVTKETWNIPTCSLTPFLKPKQV